MKPRGIIPTMVAPLSGYDELAMPGLEKRIKHILAGGVGGIFILGTTGKKGRVLCYRLRRELVERVCRYMKRRVPVLVGIADMAFVASVNLAGHAVDWMDGHLSYLSLRQRLEPTKRIRS